MAQKLLNYDVLEKLGEGARSVIYAVVDPSTKKVFALKHVIRKETKDIRFIQQMEDEFEVSKQINHPALRKSYELKINKTMLMKVTEAFLLMELFDGKPLQVRLPNSLAGVVDIFIQSAKGLNAMHLAGFVHCDIKPNNILADDQNVVKIIDFGQSCRLGTVKERIQGTPDYIAPEQVKRRPVTQQTDIFNLGATLYWALTGQPIPTLYTAGQGDNSFLVADRIPQPIDKNPQCPPGLNNLVMECISTNPAKRPANMDLVVNRLELAKHVLNRPSPTPSRAPRDVLSDSDT